MSRRSSSRPGCWTGSSSTTASSTHRRPAPDSVERARGRRGRAAVTGGDVHGVRAPSGLLRGGRSLPPRARPRCGAMPTADAAVVAAPRGGHGDPGEDECPALRGRLAELQRGLRPDQQSLGCHPHARRLDRRRRRGARGGAHVSRARQRPRRLDPHPGALLRCLRAQALARRGPHARPHPPAARHPGDAALDAAGGRPLARRRRPARRPRGAGRPRRRRGAGMALVAAAARGTRLADYRIGYVLDHPGARSPGGGRRLRRDRGARKAGAQLTEGWPAGVAVEDEPTTTRCSLRDSPPVREDSSRPPAARANQDGSSLRQALAVTASDAYFQTMEMPPPGRASGRLTSARATPSCSDRAVPRFRTTGRDPLCASSPPAGERPSDLAWTSSRPWPACPRRPRRSAHARRAAGGNADRGPYLETRRRSPWRAGSPTCRRLPPAAGVLTCR
jgi:hypothetical protein